MFQQIHRRSFFVCFFFWFRTNRFHKEVYYMGTAWACNAHCTPNSDAEKAIRKKNSKTKATHYQCRRYEKWHKNDREQFRREIPPAWLTIGQSLRKIEKPIKLWWVAWISWTADWSMIINHWIRQWTVFVFKTSNRLIRTVLLKSDSTASFLADHITRK